MSLRQTATIATVAVLTAGSASGQNAALESVSGLAFTPGGEALMAAGRHGLAIHAPGAGWRALGLQHEVSGLAVTASGVYTSAPAWRPTSLMRAARDASVWQPLPFEGDARFPAITAGFETGGLYVVADDLNDVTSRPGLYWTRDDGRKWRRVAARGLEGHVRDIAAHPSRVATIAAATSDGLFLSHDGGEHFRRIVDGQALTAATFDARGERLFFITVDADELTSLAVGGGGQAMARLPPLGIDIVNHLAASPSDPRVLAFATERRRIFLTQDAGATWKEVP